MRQKLLFILISLLTATMAWGTSGNYGTWVVSTPANAPVIKVVREHTGLGMMEAKNLVEQAHQSPCYVLEKVTLDEAKALALELNELGATAKVVDMTTDRYVRLYPREKACYFDEYGAYFGPEEEYLVGATTYQGAYYTGDYTSPFKTYLGKTDEEIQAKLDQLWNHYFKGGRDFTVYHENNNEAYILDTGNNDVRSEGMSYGMMICVQTNHKEEFDKLWKFAKSHMWHKNGQWDGYFAWHCEPSGVQKDQGCAPDAEMYFVMSLLLAANRWNEPSYMEDAQYILKKCWKNGNGSLFSDNYYVITFQPNNCPDFSDPSYDLPSFVDLFARWSNTNKDKWSKAADKTRDHLFKSSHPTSGLFSEYNNFDGTPHYEYTSSSTKYMYDAMRCAMNFGMDYYLFGNRADSITVMAKRIIDFFEKDEYQHARFNWDGTDPSESYTLGETGCNAVACYALMDARGYDEKIKRNLDMAWKAKLMTGQYRYYDGLVHYLSMLHLCGSFKIWKNMSEDIPLSYDVNNDGKVNVADVVNLVKRVKNKQYAMKYDFVDDRQLDSKDVDSAAKYVLKKKDGHK